MKTILRLAAFMAASALFAADTEPQAGAEAESNTVELDEDEVAALEAFTEAMAEMLASGRLAYCVSYTDEGNQRATYLTGVFSVDMDDWRSVKEDRPATPREVATHFEWNYAAWLRPRYRGVFAHKTHCRLFAVDADVNAMRDEDLDDFRELGHRVVETDWLPLESL